MSDDVQAATGQPTETPAPASLSPVQQAVADGDFAKFEQLEREAGTPGKPAKAPAAESATPAPGPKAAESPVLAKTDPPAPGQPVISEKERKADERLRTRVAEAVAEKDAEIARLRAQLPQPAAEPRSAPAPAAPRTMRQTIDRPDVRQAPISEAQFYTDYPDAGTGDYAEYRASHRYAYERVVEHRQRLQDESDTSRKARIDKASETLRTAEQADPTFRAKVTPLLASDAALQTSEQAASEGRRATQRNHFADELIESEAAALILTHLADHPDVLDAVDRLQSRKDVVRFFGRLEARFLDTDTPSPAAHQPPAPNKTVTSAPPPPASLGTRPVTPADPMRAAVAGDDYLAFERLEREKLVPLGRR